MAVNNNHGKRSRGPRGPGPQCRFTQQIFDGQGVSLPELQQGPARTNGVILDGASLLRGSENRILSHSLGSFFLGSPHSPTPGLLQTPHKCRRGTSCPLLKMETLNTNGRILQICAGGDRGRNRKSAHASSNSRSNSTSNYTSHFVRGRKRLVTVRSGTGLPEI